MRCLSSQTVTSYPTLASRVIIYRHDNHRRSPSQKFKGAWKACEAPASNPTSTGPETKEKALSYARERFGGRVGEVHLYDATGTVIEQTIPIAGRERR